MVTYDTLAKSDPRPPSSKKVGQIVHESVRHMVGTSDGNSGLIVGQHRYSLKLFVAKRMLARTNRSRFALLIISTFLALSSVVKADDFEEIDEIEVVGVTPTRSGGLDADKIAANIQSVTSAALEEQHSLDITEFLSRNLGSVFVNQAQNNPLQPDVQFRGFVASPLLGLPQGIAVYQDGVRINEPFGDTVNWALLPVSAIASIDLIPGSNPLFGLNTLGGALSVQTKNGWSHPGSQAEFSAGSFQRVNASIQTGGDIDGRLGYFATAAYFDEDGWRDFSPSAAGQFFGNLSLLSRASTLDLGLTLVQTDLIGNGPVPIDLMNMNRKAIFTRPDITENDLLLLNLQSSHRFGDRLSLDGNVYYRSSDVDAVNGDESDFDECEMPGNAGYLCEEEGGEESVLEDGSGDPVPFDESLAGAALNRSTTEQDTLGGTLQLSFRSESEKFDNLLIVGGSFDSSKIRFANSTELGALDASRLAVPGGVFIGDGFTELDADVDHFGLYFTDTFSPYDAVAITLSARFNTSKVLLRDKLGTALNGEHRFERLNPAAGVTYKLSQSLGVYLGYSESNRIPTPVELTCADPDDPCRLPNAFLADPPLNQVVGKTWELGVRDNSAGLDWHLGLFRTENEDDIIFISAGAITNQGYFSNVGKTARQGVEVSLRGDASDRLEWFVNYTYLKATFEQNLTMPTANNPAAVNGEVNVQSGDRLPLVPDGMLKAGFSFAVTDKLTVGAGMQYSGKMYLRGDEGNDVEQISGYAVFDMRGEYRFNKHVSTFVTIDNLFDRHYETFGLFGNPQEVLGDAFDDPRFLGPGTPRAAWIGVTLQ